MPIYDFFDTGKSESKTQPLSSERFSQQDLFARELFHSSSKEPSHDKRDRFFSSFAARLFFLLLFIANLVWGIYSITRFLALSCASLITLFKVSRLHDSRVSAFISVKRSLVCGLSLFVALFSPAFGIMIACSYFLMYDKTGIEEVVPSSLQDQFKEFMNLSE